MHAVMCDNCVVLIVGLLLLVRPLTLDVLTFSQVAITTVTLLSQCIITYSWQWWWVQMTLHRTLESLFMYVQGCLPQGIFVLCMYIVIQIACTLWYYCGMEHPVLILCLALDAISKVTYIFQATTSTLMYISTPHYQKWTTLWRYLALFEGLEDSYALGAISLLT